MDYTKCSGKNCKLADTCFRVSGPITDKKQDWFTVPPVDDTEENCDYYINEKTINLEDESKD